MDINISRLRSDLAKRRPDWQQLSKETGVSEKTLFRIAHGPDYYPNLRTAEQIAQWLAKVAA